MSPRSHVADRPDRVHVPTALASAVVGARSAPAPPAPVSAPGRAGVRASYDHFVVRGPVAAVRPTGAPPRVPVAVPPWRGAAVRARARRDDRRDDDALRAETRAVDRLPVAVAPADAGSPSCALALRPGPVPVPEPAPHRAPPALVSLWDPPAPTALLEPAPEGRRARGHVDVRISNVLQRLLVLERSHRGMTRGEPGAVAAMLDLAVSLEQELRDLARTIDGDLPDLDADDVHRHRARIAYAARRIVRMMVLTDRAAED